MLIKQFNTYAINFSFVTLFLCSFSTIKSQPLIADEYIQENKIASYSRQKLILLDFWATWCGPCIPATKHLESLQKSTKDLIYMISVSDESTEKIKSFILRKPIDLMILSDYNQFLFSKFGVNKRPYCVLLDHYGKLLWQGHPSSLNVNLIKSFHHTAKEIPNEYGLSDLIKINSTALKNKEVLLNNKYTIEESTSEYEGINVIDNQVIYEGKLHTLLAHLKEVYNYQIKIRSEEKNKKIKLVSNDIFWNESKKELLEDLIKKYELDIDVKEELVTVNELISFNKKLLWDVNQLDWGPQKNLFIVGDERLQANDVNLYNLSRKLSEVLEKPFYFGADDDKEYDWDFHIKYTDFMLEELENSFGIKLKTTNINMNIYYVN